MKANIFNFRNCGLDKTYEVREMKYEFREVKCPWCDHVFMWNKDGREGLIIHHYRLKETGKYVEEAKCPKCAEKMIVLDKVFEGIDIDDERIERIGVRGV